MEKKKIKSKKTQDVIQMDRYFFVSDSIRFIAKEFSF